MTKASSSIDFTVAQDDKAEDLRRRFALIDVREDFEIEALPFKSDYHIPTSAFDIGMLDAPKDRELLVICARGVRSHKAAEYLRGQGWAKAYSLAGGVGEFPAG